MANRTANFILTIALSFTGIPGYGAVKGGRHKLWYIQPAKALNEALPVCKGRQCHWYTPGINLHSFFDTPEIKEPVIREPVRRNFGCSETLNFAGITYA